jgi:diguanylate cyclase (GGDEF)-like protein
MSNAKLKQELLSILEHKKLTPFFQPIISVVKKEIIGYEALIRGPSDSVFHNPNHLFNVAEKYELISELDMLCRELSIQHYANSNLNSKLLFINVSPYALLQPKFKTGETLRYLEQFGLNPHDVVIELTEHKPFEDYELMLNAVAYYRGMGFDIALDDLGAGYSSNVRLWSEVLPEYIKIDQHFVQGLPEDSLKFNFLRSIQGIANALNCNIIAEGIETEAEFKAIENLNISHAQGHYLARPATMPLVRLNNSIFKGDSLADKHFLHQVIAVEIISQFIEPISANTHIKEVMNIFQHHNELTMLPLVDHGVASGIIFRDVFLSKLFSNRYGIDLYGRKPVKIFIDHVPLHIDCKTPIESVSMQLTSAAHPEQAFIITRDGKYIGVGTVLSLLEVVTRQQIDNAKYANPLTLLPGSVPMNEQVNQLLASNTLFAFGYFDLDNFKPFNDIYGYSAGDDIIKAVASILKECVPTEHGFVGHIGGDDFIVIFTCDDWLNLCQKILAAFELRARDYYKSDDVNAGGIWAENRIGEKCFFPIMSLSVGLVAPETTCHCQSHVDVADLAAEAKKLAKKTEGNSYFVNHRNHPQTLEKTENSLL